MSETPADETLSPESTQEVKSIMPKKAAKKAAKPKPPKAARRNNDNPLRALAVVPDPIWGCAQPYCKYQGPFNCVVRTRVVLFVPKNPNLGNRYPDEIWIKYFNQSDKRKATVALCVANGSSPYPVSFTVLEPDGCVCISSSPATDTICDGNQKYLGIYLRWIHPTNQTVEYENTLFKDIVIDCTGLNRCADQPNACTS